MEFLFGLVYALAMVVIVPLAVFAMVMAMFFTVSSKKALFGVFAAILAVWLSGIDPVSGFAWVALVYVGLSVSIVGVLLGMLWGLIWVWRNSSIGRMALFGCLCIFGGLWVIAMVAGEFQPDPHGCDASMMARFVC